MDSAGGDGAAVTVPQGAQGEDDLLERLRRGDEAAFLQVVDTWWRPMLHVARSHVATDASAQEVVQDTWLAVLRGLPRFEGRSSLRTWVFRILVNTAKTRGVRESRTLPFSSLGDDDRGPTVTPDRFQRDDDELPGHWTDAGTPRRWDVDPEDGALRDEVHGLIDSALLRLPGRQRAVVVLRDVHGCTSEEVCEFLGLTAQNQRVLLHRGRAKVRTALEDYYLRAAR